MASFYATEISKIVGPDVDARHVEAFMRLQYGTLDHLSKATFKREAMISAACVAESGAAESERLAQ